ncbi:hypothetical protein [Mycoplasma struthionis]|uniref:Uncharacterized protein n=1 Tax=Mycoplasma struthionis TaxID=538220 RepID=A0A502M225_9MOLU|nr:hypothetical protein [Mycoplasma struthionis]TPI01945.1 hypothetical protein FJM01_01665 [Mycoplasma struthionis]
MFSDDTLHLKPQRQEVLSKLKELQKTANNARLYTSKIDNNTLKFSLKSSDNKKADQDQQLVIQLVDGFEDKDNLSTILFNSMLHADNGVDGSKEKNSKFVPIKWEGEGDTMRFYLYVKLSGDGSQDVTKKGAKITPSNKILKIYIN